MSLKINRVRSRALALVLLAGAMTGAGCVTRPKEAKGPAADAIEAALTVNLSSERLILLERIAGRDDLSQVDQIYLVNAICHGGIGGEQADALITLINNPRCTTQTRRHIASKLRHVYYSTERRRVAEALTDAAENEPVAEP